MSNEELTILLLDSIGWSYEEVANPWHYKNTKDLYMGDLIHAIFEQGTTVKAAEALGVPYKTVLTSTTRFLVPRFGNLNGGGETWKWKFLIHLGLQYCSSCKALLELSSYDKDAHASTGRHHYCKSCRREANASQYKKEATKESHKKSYDTHKDEIYARNAEYRADRSKRVPKWSQVDEIKEFYKNCPEGSHVDHKLPLKGKLVSGLHVIENLQYLTAEENIRKGNRIDLKEYNKQLNTAPMVKPR